MLHKHCSGYEQHALHFLTLQNDECDPRGYRFHEQPTDQRTWFLNAAEDDSYASYVHFLKGEADEHFKNVSHQQRLDIREKQYLQEYNDFVSVLESIEELKCDTDIDIEWAETPAFWQLIDDRFCAMHRLNMLEQFPLCFVLRAPISTEPWHIPVHDC